MSPLVVLGLVVFGMFLGLLYEKARDVLDLHGRVGRSNDVLPPAAPQPVLPPRRRRRRTDD